MIQSKIQHPLGLAITAFASLAMVGVFHTILGTSLPAMRLSFDMDTAQAGLLGSVAWFGFTLAVFGGGALSDIFMRPRVLMVACVMIGLGAISLGAWKTYSVNCFLMGVIGGGTGIIVSSSSALIIEVYPRKAGVILNVHHFFYGVGAIMGPLAMGYVLNRGWLWQWIYKLGGVTMLLLAGSFAFLKGHKKGGSTLDYGSFLGLLKEKNLILLTLVTILAIGTQNGLFFWLVSFLKEVRLLPILVAGWGLSLFSVGMAAGRLLSGGLTAWLGNTRVLLILLILLDAAVLLFLHVSDKNWTLAVCLMAGLACSGLFPGVLALGGINVPHLAGTTMGILGTAAGVGSTLMPWLMSVVSEPTSLKAGFLVTILAVSFSLGLFIVSYRRFQNSEKAG